jgi:dGTPase
MITPAQLEGIALWEILIETFKWRGPTLKDMDRHRMIRHLIGLEVSDVIQATDARLKESGAQSPADIQRLPYNVLGHSDDMVRRNRELKDFLYNKLYRHPRVVRMAVKAERVISDLFNAYVNEPAILPTHVQQLLEHRSLERTVCDHIAGMTDRYAIDEHSKLFDATIQP